MCDYARLPRTIVLAVLAIASAICTRLPAAPSGYEEFLRRQGIKSDDASLRSFLQLAASVDDAKTADLIAKLGDNDFQQREAATRQLARLPGLKPEALDRAINSPDSQVIWRAQAIARLRQRDATRPDQILHAVLRVVEQRPPAAITSLLLDVAPLCASGYLRDAQRDALRAAVGAGDRELLHKSIESGATARRQAAIFSLAALDGENAVAPLMRLFNDRDEFVRLAAATQVARLGDRAALAELVRLLDTEGPDVRAESVRLLRRVTGQKFGYDADAATEARTAAARRWNSWLAEHGARAKLHPVDDPTRYVACVEAGSLVGLDETGSVLWRFDEIPGWQFKRIHTPSGCQRLANDHWLVTSRSMPWLFELAPDGRLVCSLRIPSPAGSLQRLESGNLLMCLGGQSRIVEITPTGDVRWSPTVKGLPGDAVRLPNGNTLVSVHNLNKLVELNAEGRRVRVFENLPAPASVRRLPTGNLLMAHYKGSVGEYTPEGRTVWTLGGFSSPPDVIALDNGHLLIADEDGVREVTRDARAIWQAKLGKVERLYQVP